MASSPAHGGLQAVHKLPEVPQDSWEDALPNHTPSLIMLRSVCLALVAATGLASAETGIDAWLRYAPFPGAEQYLDRVPSAVLALNNTVGSPVYTAAQELLTGIGGIFGKEVAQAAPGHSNGAAVVGTVEQFRMANRAVNTTETLIEDGYYLDVQGPTVTIVGQNERGALYGAFKYLSLVAQGNVTDYSIVSNPSVPIRWTNEWNNLQAGGTHGSVERGYGGPSIFWENGTVKTGKPGGNPSHTIIESCSD